MSILGDDDGLLGSTPSGSENNYVASLGRISGKLLSDNLLRNGVDLAFNNDLLYLKVSPIIRGSEADGEDGDPNYDSTLPAALSGTGVGINTDTPVYILDVNDTIRSDTVNVPNLTTIENITINANGTIGSVTGPIHIQSTNIYSSVFYTSMSSDYLEFNDNRINSISNRNIKLDPNGSGRVVFEADTSIYGNLQVTGNISVTEDLATMGTIIVGDSPLDTVTIVPDFTQSIIPGTDNAYDLGMQANDSSPRRWDYAHIPDWTNISRLLPQTVVVNDSLLINGVINKIEPTITNSNVLLNPATGITYIERTKWQDDTITNLNDTALTFKSTGIGYVRFMGTNGFIIPVGDTSQQRPSPELGETRWNLDEDYLECWNGSEWVVSTGGGEIVTNQYMEDLGFVYSIILG
jgi:hypothetical protein